MIRRVLALLLVMAVAATAAANYRKDYSRGVQAVEREDWEQAVQYLREAVGANPDAGGSRVQIYGVRYEPYVPYYYLGFALKRSDRLAEALEAWQTADAQGVIHETELSQEVRDGIKELQARLAPTPSADTVAGLSTEDFAGYVKAAEAELQRATAAADALREMCSSPVGQEILAADPEISRRQEWAGQTIDAARLDLESGRGQGQLASVLAARDQAMQAREELDVALRSLEQRRALLLQPSPTVPPQPTDTPQPTATVPPPTSTPEPTATVPAVLATPVADSPPPSVAPEWLRTAIESYLQGRHEEVVESLQVIDESDAATAAVAYLMRAASSYSLSRLGVAAAEDLAAAAAEDARSCRRLHAGIAPSDQVFSPSFVEFFAAGIGPDQNR